MEEMEDLAEMVCLWVEASARFYFWNGAWRNVGNKILLLLEK
jgi:hypothetical protein